MITPVDMTPVSKLVDFNSGPFSNNKIYSVGIQRLICQQLLRELLKNPAQNQADIILVNETLKRFG